MKYSEGEWEYIEELGAKFSAVVAQNAVVCGLPNPTADEVAELEEMRANARLIIKAPKMYQCLIAIKNAMKNELRITDHVFGYGVFLTERSQKLLFGAIDEVIDGIEEGE